jgi:arginine utilization protein RocB
MLLGPDHTAHGWYEQVRVYTLRLVRIASVSPGSGENLVAQEALRILHEGGLADAYAASGLDPIPGDPYSRHNAYAFVRGAGPQTVVLLGHIDTVGTADYGPLEPWALEPEQLAARSAELAAITEGLAGDLEQHPGDWLFGRGVADMKSGVATTLAVTRRLAEQARSGALPFSVVLLATPDEENESAGVLQGVRLLLRLREEHGLRYVGAINTDYTTSRYPDDPHRYVYTGSIGKLLPSFLVIGRESHVGDPFDGADANLLAAELIRDLSMADELCDALDGQLAPPPVTLHARDLKERYDVQLPFQAHFYLNVLTYMTGPGELLERLRLRSEAALARALLRLDEAQRRWLTAAGETARAATLMPRRGHVLTYAELSQQATERLGMAAVRAALDDEWARWPEDTDKRERSLQLVRRLWTLAGLRGPAVVLYFSPPYYPQVRTGDGPLLRAVREVAARHPEVPLVEQGHFPFLSDMSYLRLDAGDDVAALTANMPVWAPEGDDSRPGAYRLPLVELRALGLDVINLGPYGRGAHQRGERLLQSYSFGVLPQLVYETVQRAAELAGAETDDG